ncbi:ABC transporter ATP-binding protein [Candidatus Gracilibacteria bacterium]|nr:ABC transporter ATP-binding protein [Candidatus Gracilibacteria bacterium]
MLIELKDLHKSYFLENGEEVPVLKGVNLSVDTGNFIALMGESGSGKTTLLNVIGALHPLTKGEYILEGENISEIDDDETLSYIRNKKMGYIFQQFNLLPKLNALENVALPALYLGVNKKERLEKATKLLEKVGLQDKLNSFPGELSGGQQQRISIARSLINDPDILLADEPTGSLDSKVSLEIMELILSLKKSGKTIIMVTHAPLVAKYADKIIFLEDGVITNYDYKI